MILRNMEKEELVIKLLNECLKYKDITKQAHVSLSDISKIKRKITCEEIEKPLSIPSKSFQLFSKRKSLVEVAICLDISKDGNYQSIFRFLGFT
jgi:hypothetical protein